MAHDIMIVRESPRESMRETLTLFFKRRSMIIVVFLSVVITVTAASFLARPVYQAKSSILIKYGREYLYHPEVGTTPQPVMTLNQEEVLNSEIQILTSRDLLKKVVATLGPENIYPDLVKDPPKGVTPLDLATAVFAKKLKVEGVKKSSVIEITFRHSNPQMAAKAVNLLVDMYKEKHLQVFSNPHSSFLEGQVATLRQKLSDTEDRMQSFKQKNQVYSLDEQRTMLLRQRTELETEMMSTRDSISELQKKVVSYKAQTKEMLQNKNLYTQTERDKIIVEARSRLLALQLNEQELLRKYTESNKLVVDVRKEILIVKDFLKEQESEIRTRTTTGNAVFQEAQKGLVTAEAELSAQNAKLATLSGQLGELNGKVRALDMSEKDMQGLKRELSVNEKNYQTYGDKMEEAQISEDMNRLKMANISVIEAATVPTKPVTPKIPLNIALGIVFGALSSFGLAYLSERSTQTFTDPDSAARRLNLAVVACIPYKD
ncbi:MAG TPA: GumC family protein [Geobacteraceae bacterium]|nr:GumC family protein [Geobacteraceae bacterium]